MSGDLHEVLERGDLAGLQARLSADPALATTEMPPFPGHPGGAMPLSFVAMLRYDAPGGVWRDVPGAALLAELLLAAGAPVEGLMGDGESPLITAASYGDAEVAALLIRAGADLEAAASTTSGGVPGGTPLLHAAVFGMTAVVDVLVAAGAVVPDAVQAAAAGLEDQVALDGPPDERIRALVMAAGHQRIGVIDRLVEAGTPVDGVDPIWAGHPLRTAAGDGRAVSVRRLLELGADPEARDDEGMTALDLCRAGAATHPGFPGYPETAALLTTP